MGHCGDRTAKTRAVELRTLDTLEARKDLSGYLPLQHERP